MTSMKGKTMTTQLETDLILCTVIIQMLENQKHIWSNRLASAGEIRHDDDAERIQFILDSIDLEISRQQEQIKYIARYVVQPKIKE
jgi:hypothetical protein